MKRPITWNPARLPAYNAGDAAGVLHGRDRNRCAAANPHRIGSDEWSAFNQGFRRKDLGPCSYRPGQCVHTRCQIAAGQRVPVADFNELFRGELERGWLRFDLERPEVRRARATLYWAMKRAWKETGDFSFLTVALNGCLPHA